MKRFDFLRNNLANDFPPRDEREVVEVVTETVTTYEDDDWEESWESSDDDY